jgi:hypothetical protein
MIAVLVSLVALIAAGALAIDAGAIWVARTHLQNAADAAALAGAKDLVDSTGNVSLSVAQSQALSFGAQNESIHESVTILPGDLEFGSWDPDARTFDTSVDLSDPELVTALKVRTRADGSPNSPVSAFFSRVLGRTSFDVGAEAIAYLGFAGPPGPGGVPLPIAIDCCELRGSPHCDQDYCATINSNPPNPCMLDDPQDDGVTQVSCLEFFSTPEQNACWTSLEQFDSSVNTPEMLDIIRNNNMDEVPDYIQLDNGTKTPVISEINDRFQGSGNWDLSNRSGEDIYLPKTGVADSWVVALPVVECQDSDNCAGSQPALIVGFVCFEIREVVVTPDKIIRGRFLCPGDDAMDRCDLPSSSGGGPFGIRAQFPVLVQ